jgi:hypothetical protein
MKIGPFTFTRDSALWTWGLLVSVVAGLAMLDDHFAVATLGIPLAYLTKIRLANFVMGLISAKAGNSFLQHSKDVEASSRVDVSKLAPVMLVGILSGAAVLSLQGCAAHQAPAVSPAQQAAAVLQRVDELQNAVISTNQLTPGAIPDSIAVPLVRFCVEAAKVLKASPNGVLPAIAAEWRDLKAQIPIRYRQMPAIAAAFIAVDVALAEVGVEPAATPAPQASAGAPPSKTHAHLKAVGATAVGVGIIAACVYSGSGCGFMGGAA